jgi:TRAP-type mannitol/chloroaromatic compound transport system permease small subunit
MNQALALAARIDRLNARFGVLAQWLLLACVAVSAGNALMRYGFDRSSNGWLEIQWYLFSAAFLLAAPWVLRHNAHVRIDLISQRYSERTRAWIDIFGTLLMLLPLALLIFWFGAFDALDAWQTQEISSDAGGLVRWPIKAIVPLAFLLLILQALSELIRKIAFLQGLAPFADAGECDDEAHRHEVE